MTTTINPPDQPKSDSPPILEARGIRKQFPGVLALDDVNMAVRPGEARALIGQNGCGKSTLIKVIAGVHPCDGGDLYLDGEEVKPSSPAEAVDLGISTIHQEVNLIPLRSVAENLFLAREPKIGPFINQKKLVADAEQLLARYGLEHVNPNTQLNRLSVAVRQMVAIIRAVSQDARVVIMDEPTSSLETAEVDQLFGISNQLLDEGRSVIFVSHRLSELYEICTTATVLRDGRLVYDGALGTLSKNALVTTMIGREGTDVTVKATGFRPRGDEEHEPNFVAENIKADGISDASVTVRAGEIVGVAGLLGAGRTEFAEAIFGLRRRTAGQGSLAEDRLPKSPAEALAAGMALVPEERRAQGIFPGLSVRENLLAAIIPNLTKRGLIDKAEADRIVDEYVAALDIKLADVNQPIEQLSGGNQQKVILARCLSIEPKLLITDEPTRGIDVGAKFEIQSRISDLAEDGMSVLLISSELEELIEGTDRTVVMREGETVGELTRAELGEGKLVDLMSGSEEDAT